MKWMILLFLALSLNANAGIINPSVRNLSVNGSTALQGAITLTASGSIVLAQTGQNINISSSATSITPTVQSFITGSGTYTRPSNPTPLYLKVRLVGGGGGGGGSGTAVGQGTDGGNGGQTTFGTNLLIGNGGHGGLGTGGPGSGLGTAFLGTAVGFAVQGGAGGAAANNVLTNIGDFPAQPGGNSPFGGAGVSNFNNGANAVANTGSGGGGAGLNAASGTNQGGGSGQAGGYVDAIINQPSSTYSYAVGAAGTQGTAGTNGNNGGTGGSGFIIVEEHYQ